jgi:predicted dehydrogenase
MKDWTRREFLAASALAAAAQDAPKRAIPASEKIVLGFIGTGGMGTGLINTFKGFPQVEIAAVCDVHEPHRLRARSESGASPEAYGDFRRILDRKDIDAVVVATPDHWHAIIAIMACQAGKDVYCEKPLGHRIQETRAMVTAAEKAGRVTQMGNLIHAEKNYARVVEIVRSGVLGKISKTRVWMAADRRGLGRPADGPPPTGS